MEIRQLRHFVAAAEAKNLRKASENIHISHPALSMSIKKLELDLGVVLLNKNRQGVQLTATGEVFLQSAKSLLRQIDALKISLQNSETYPVGSVKLGVPYGTNNAIAAPLFRIMSNRFPGINLELQEGNTSMLEASFDSGHIDLMVNYDYKEKPNQRVEPLYTESLYFVRAYQPDLEGVEEIELKELEKYSIGSQPGNHSLPRTIEKYARENKVNFSYVLDFRSAGATLKIAEAGLIAIICPWDWVHDQVASKRLSAVKIVNPSMNRTACLVSRLDGQSNLALSSTIPAIKEAIHIASVEGTIRGEMLGDSGR